MVQQSGVAINIRRPRLGCRTSPFQAGMPAVGSHREGGLPEIASHGHKTQPSGFTTARGQAISLTTEQVRRAEQLLEVSESSTTSMSEASLGNIQDSTLVHTRAEHDVGMLKTAAGGLVAIQGPPLQQAKRLLGELDIVFPANCTQVVFTGSAQQEHREFDRNRFPVYSKPAVHAGCSVAAGESFELQSKTLQRTPCFPSDLANRGLQSGATKLNGALEAQKGFSTAAGTAISLLPENLKVAQKILSDTEHKAVEIERPEPHHALVGKGGFSTAAGVAIKLQAQNMQVARRLLSSDEYGELDGETDKLNCETETHGSWRTLAAAAPKLVFENINNAHTLSDANHRALESNGPELHCAPAGKGGFSTASGAKLRLQPENLKIAQRLLSDAEHTEFESRASEPHCAAEVNTRFNAVPEAELKSMPEERCTQQHLSDVCHGNFESKGPELHIAWAVHGGFSTAAGDVLKMDSESMKVAQRLLSDSSEVDEGPSGRSTTRTSRGCPAKSPPDLGLPSMSSLSSSRKLPVASLSPRVAVAPKRTRVQNARGFLADLQHRAKRTRRICLHEPVKTPPVIREEDEKARTAASRTCAAVPSTQTARSTDASCKPEVVREAVWPENFVQSASVPAPSVLWTELGAQAQKQKHSLDTKPHMQPAVAQSNDGISSADLMSMLNAEDDSLEAPFHPSFAIAAPSPPLRDSVEPLFARFQRLLDSSEGQVWSSINIGDRCQRSRFGLPWFEMQCRQLALSFALQPRRCWRSRAEHQEAICSRLLRRCRAEAAGGTSAIRRICESGKLGDQHMVLLCSAVQSRSTGFEIASVELSDGWYFITAHLDSQLQQVVETGQLRAGRKIRICLGHASGIPAGGCDPLELPQEARLHLSSNGCRPAPRNLRLGFKQKAFPPARISQLRIGSGSIPLIDVVVLRVLPPVFVKWSGGAKNGENTGARVPEERSYSQECARKERLAHDEYELAVAELRTAANAPEEGFARQDDDYQVVERIQARVRSRLEDDAATPQQQLVVLDAQEVRRPQSRWWESLALLKLPGSSPETEGAGFHIFQRIRLSSVKAGASKSGPVRLYASRFSRFEECQAEQGLGPRGLPSSNLPKSPFCCDLIASSCAPAQGAMVWSTVMNNKLGRLPVLTASSNMPEGSVPDRSFRGHFCDLMGVILQVEPVEVTGVGSVTQSSWRATCAIYVLGPGQRVCRVLVEDYASDSAEVRARLSKAWASYLNAQSDIHAGSEPKVVVLENVTFDWHEFRTGLIHFKARRLYLRVSSTPSEPGFRQAMEWAFFSAADVTRALASLPQPA